ncbi:MAG: L-threonylcarbamoyladenylate synthase [Candidatus Paceibacterota bacterium]
MQEAQWLREGKVGVLATDTLYGLVAAAAQEQAVRRVYELKKRTPTKPCIILISSFDDLQAFDIELQPSRRAVLARYWPGPTSIVMPCGPSVPEYLHPGTRTLAFRMPHDAALLTLLSESGPLVAPSANPEGELPARTIEEARRYFGDKIDFYLEGGERVGEPSTLIALTDKNEMTTVRKGRQATH